MSNKSKYGNLKRGDACPISGKIFWAYGKNFINNEYWVSAEKFEYLSEKLKKYSSENPEKRRKSIRKHRLANRNKINLARREKRKKDPVATKARDLKYNQSRDLSKLSESRKNKRASDPMFALACRVRARTSYAFSNKQYSKTSKTRELIGCDWGFLQMHIEKQFTKGMSWENKHLWHIDHIVPLSSAKTEEEMKARCNYMNLRPMWAFENMSKGSKTEHLLLTA